jgi:hypothetical protein
MAEEFDLTADETVQRYHVSKLILDWDKSKIHIRIRDEDGREYVFKYISDTALQLMNSLNKVDLSTNSLHKRIMERLATDGFISAGTVTGTPD